MKRFFSILIVLLLGFSFIAKAQTFLISQQGTHTTCSGTFYDSGGAGGSYGNNENYTITFCSAIPNAHIIVTFTAFQLESSYDKFSVFDGPTSTSTPFVTNASGNALNGQTFTSSGTCLTFTFTSDGSVTYAGWSATISCSFPCQNFSMAIVGVNPPLTNPDSLWIDVCQGQSVTFTAQGTYPLSGQGYVQSDATTEFFWTVAGTYIDEISGVGMNTLTHTFNEGGGFFVSLTAVDINNCEAHVLEQYRVRVSLSPTINASSDVSIICPNETVNFFGSVVPTPWVLPVTETQILEECFYDHYEGTVCFNVNAFQPGQTITSMYDVQSFCINMEHSYIGDFYMYLRCPNGQESMLHEYYNCNNSYFGLPDHNDNCNPGIGWTYCWSMSATQPVTAICQSDQSVPAGTYLPLSSFSNLIGCPINGEWCVRFFDNWGIDDGTIFYADLTFSPAIIPADLWSYTNSYSTNNIQWTGNGVSPNSGGNAVAHPNTPGNQGFTFTVTDNFGCSYDTTIYVTVRQYDDPLCCVFPTPNAGADAEVCSNSYTFNAGITQGNTVTWSMLSGPGTATWVNQNSPNATVTVSQYGTYVFQINEQNQSPGCSTNDQVQIIFKETPTSTFTMTAIPCFGNSTTITYTGNASPTATYNWTFDGGQVLSGSGAGPYQVSWATAGSHTVTLQIVQNTCTSNITSNNIITPAQLTHNLTIQNDPCYQSCHGRATILVQGGTAPYNYSWASGGPQLNGLCAGAYTITVTDQNGCSTSQNFIVTEPSQLVVTNIQTTNLNCYNSHDGEIHITAVGGTGNLMFIWNDIGVADSVRTGLAAGNYTCTIVDANQCQTVEFIQITQPNELIVSISQDTAICEWSSTIITTNAIGGVPLYTYYWNSGAGFDVGPSNITVSPHQTTTYSFYVEDGHGCVSNTASATIIVSPQLVFDTIIVKNNRCFESCDGRIELQMIGGIPPLQYSWGSPNHVYNGLCAGLYPVTVTDNIGCSINTVVVVSQPDEISYSLHTEPASCYGYNDGQATIFVEGGTEPYTYIWPNGYSDMTLVASAGVYTVTVLDANFCRIEVPATITQPSRIIVQPISAQKICIGQSANISASALGGVPYYSYLWHGSDGSVYPTAAVTVSPQTTTDYYVTVTDSKGCIGNIGYVRVEVFPPLTITAVVTSWDTVCPNSPAIIEVDAIGGNGGPYMLHLQDGSVVASPFTVYPNETTMYYITLVDGCGTPSVMDSILINVYPEPENLFIADRVKGCPGVPINFTELSEDVGQGFLWNFGDNGYDIIKNPTHIYKEPGVYSVSLTTRSDFGCTTTRIIYDMISIFENPIADFTATPTTVTFLDGDVFCDNNSVMADYVYWFFGDGDSSLVYSPWHRYEKPGIFEIILVVENEDGCTDTTRRSITVNGEFSFYAPTMFTPNGDGKNDCFRVCGVGIDKHNFYLAVYDRWGNKVFETTTFKPDAICKSCTEGAWDGTNRGNADLGDEILPNGAYTWFCDFKDLFGTIHKRTGTVHLTR